MSIQITSIDSVKFDKFEGDKDSELTKHLNDILSTGKVSPQSDLEMFLLNTSIHLLFDFQEVVSKFDYNPFKFNIPESLMPFVFPVEPSLMSPEQKADYHLNRVAYLERIFKGLEEDPREINGYSSFLLNFFFKNQFGNKGPKTKQNAYVQFQHLESNVADFYAMFSSRRFGRDRYLTGVDSQGNLYTKKRQRLGDFSDDFIRLHPHILFSLAFPPEVFNDLIPDYARWANDKNRLKDYGTDSIVGGDLLRAGQEGKVFHSSLPHEILIGDGTLESMTVKDNPPNAVSFLNKFSDETVSLGYLSNLSNGQVNFLLSDFLADIVCNDFFDTRRTYPLLNIAGAIARDMFVCEEKDRHYDVSTERQYERRGKKKKKIGEKVVWLPRFRFSLDKEHSGRTLSDKLISLSPCHVSGHMRKCENPSQDQVELAESVGISLPPGFTYVREHDRGRSREFSRYYKSRSAMQVLYGDD